MYLIAIVALIATSAFYCRAKCAGLHPGKAASVPFIAAGILFGCAYLASIGIAKIATATNASPFTVNAVEFMLNVFLLLAYLMVIRKNWIALVRASEMAKIGEPRE